MSKNTTHRRKRFIFEMKVEFPFLAYPEEERKEHDKIAMAIIQAIENATGIPCGQLRDCKTGRFRPIKKMRQ